ncbi:phage holin family protein [Demequina lignilytica]|uniref:Phage holin family protein n=1 Tax=Demequina lignilytica TaxID=3051663 RepID=A0AB35MHF1_9MICO|nr:phage holin family protein [Demequina sp. SYSU T0a273]MDN4483151.1 phage holin family protein [Demequina sp. SYSU T0a273]
MIRFVVNALIFLGSAAVGLWVTSLVVDGFSITGVGIVMAVVIFAILQSILSPFIFKMTTKYASAFTGGVGLVSTFVSLLITSLISDNLSIDGVTAWIASTVLVWLFTAIATWLLPLIFLRNQVEKRRD